MTQGPAELPPRVEVVGNPRAVGFCEEWYVLNAEEHFWFRWRLRAFQTQLRALKLDTAPLRVLDIGCGTGLLRSQLESVTPWTVDCSDLNPEALGRVKPGRGRVLFYDALSEDPSLTSRYDAVLVFDLLEHLEEPRRMLAAAARHLRPGGWVFVNVPALPSLLSDYDRAAGHLRRYNKRALAAEIKACGLQEVEARYWGLALVPLLALRKILVRRKSNRDDQRVIRKGLAPPNRFAANFLACVMRCETALARKPPVGASLLSVARAPM